MRDLAKLRLDSHLLRSGDIRLFYNCDHQPDNVELVDAIVEQANVSGPKQVEIEAKFVEITQNNLKELGFDWLLAPFNVGNHKVFGSGGTSGTAPGINNADFPFQFTNEI